MRCGKVAPSDRSRRSVWIAKLRNQATAQVELLDTLYQQPGRKLPPLPMPADAEIIVGDLVLLEVLQGARDEAHASRIEKLLREFQIVPMLDDEVAVEAARNVRALRAHGVTIRKTVDLIIGTFCIVQGHALLHDDRDFLPMTEHLGLRTVAVS